MSIFRIIYCIFEGHAYVDVVTTPRQPYQYCLHCGKVKEPVAILKTRPAGRRHDLFSN
jgi:hypothetical protein